MRLNPWGVLVAGNLYLGLVALAWPIMAFMGGFAFDAPSGAISAFADWFRHIAVFLIFLYPIVFLVSLVGSILAYRAGASVHTLLLWFLPSFLTPPPWLLPVLVFYLVFAVAVD